MAIFLEALALMTTHLVEDQPHTDTVSNSVWTLVLQLTLRDHCFSDLVSFQI